MSALNEWLDDPENVNPEPYIFKVSEVSGISPDVLFSKVRWREVVKARSLIYAVLHELGFSYPRIGEIMERNHSTVMSGAKQVPYEAVRELIEMVKVN